LGAAPCSAAGHGAARQCGERHESLALLGWAFWLAWTNIQGERLRTRWVWYGWWTAPLLTTGFVLTGAGVGGGLKTILLSVSILTVLALVVSRRLFFLATQGHL